ncbi:MAG TPA: hypothetical protein VK206_02110 [Anaerolineales bacterium]|nr:hypothetical protein [Anaerolineales bacterium]
MIEKGMFFRNNASAELSYSVKGKNYYIESFDKRGEEFLFRVDVGDEITLHKSGGDVVKMVVVDCEDVPPIQCLARQLP